MTQLDYAQLIGLWEFVTATTPVGDPHLMAAIAMAESGGNTEAVNATDNHGTQTSWGLWQISDGTHNQPVADILDPVVNAQQAVAKLHSQGLTAWGTYDSGAYRQFYDPSVAAVPWAAPPIPTPPPEADTMDNITFVTFLYRFLLCRAPDAAGLQTWVNELNNGTQRAEVWAVIQNSTEGQEVIAAQRKLLGLPPQPTP